jgi:hypothetical protein
VFGIAIGSVWSDVQGFLADVPDEAAEQPEPGEPASERSGRWLRPVG